MDTQVIEGMRTKIKEFGVNQVAKKSGLSHSTVKKFLYDSPDGMRDSTILALAKGIAGCRAKTTRLGVSLNKIMRQ